MKNYIKKGLNIIQNDGLQVFVNRLFNYSQVRFKRFYKYNNIEEINRFRSIKNKYKNKKVFLFCNGPSLNKTPLHFLENEYTMCCNRFNLFYDRINWKPDFYIATDDLVIKDTYNEINDQIISKSKLCFFPDIHPSNIEIKDKLISQHKNVFWLNTDIPDFSLNLPFCGINKTVINPALQILAYLGFKEIYLLGMDLTFDNQTVKKHNSRDWTGIKDDDNNHFDPRYFGKGYSYHNPTVHEMIEVFHEAKFFFDSYGINIYNATIGGELEVFPRRNFYDIFQYSKKEDIMLFLRNFDIKDYQTGNIEEYFSNSYVINSVSEFNKNKNYVVCDVDIAIKLIPKVMEDFIPLGPVLGKYLFIKREK